MPWIMNIVHANSAPPDTDSPPITIPNHAKVTRVEVAQQEGQGVVDFRLYFQEAGSTEGNWTDWAVGNTGGERPGKIINIDAGYFLAGIHANCSEAAGIVDLRFDLRKHDGTLLDVAETPSATGISGTEYHVQVPFEARDPEGNLRAYHIVGVLAYTETGRGVTDIGFRYQLLPLGDAGLQLVNLEAKSEP